MRTRWMSIQQGNQAHPGLSLQAVTLEDGTRIRGCPNAGILPAGFHRAHLGGREIDLLVRPRLPAPRRRIACLSIFVNNLHSSGAWGVGDFVDLRDVAVSVAPKGVDMLALGPVAATPVAGPIPGSPYSPSSRMFKSLLHLRPESIPGWSDVAGVIGAPPERNANVKGGDLLDLATARERKLPALRALFARAERMDVEADQEFTAFRLAMCPELAAFAAFSAAETEHGPEWRSWPRELRSWESARESAWLNSRRRDVLFMAWCQWWLDKQLADVAAVLPLITDLPVGFPPMSADAWLWQDALDFDAQLGSPADYFNPSGHAWGLVPFAPSALRRLRYRPWRAAIRNTLRHAAGIRVDHAYGLFRQYWLERDRSSAGRFVRQDTRALADLLVLEAHRQNAFVITEELGTAPPRINELRRYGFQRLVPFASDQYDSSDPPEVTSASCHDLPPLATYLSDDGAEARYVMDHEFHERCRAKFRVVTRTRLEDEHSSSPAAVYEQLARSGATVVIFSLADALMDTRPFNLPGVPETEFPSFLARHPPLTDVIQTPGFEQIARAIHVGFSSCPSLREGAR